MKSYWRKLQVIALTNIEQARFFSNDIVRLLKFLPYATHWDALWQNASCIYLIRSALCEPLALLQLELLNDAVIVHAVLRQDYRQASIKHSVLPNLVLYVLGQLVFVIHQKKIILFFSEQNKGVKGFVRRMRLKPTMLNDKYVYMITPKLIDDFLSLNKGE